MGFLTILEFFTISSEYFTVLAATVIIISLSWILRRRPPAGLKTLPGPVGLPILGYLPFMTRKPYVTLTELAKKYGPVYQIKLGSKPVLILADFNVIREAFASDAFMGRPVDFPFEVSEETKKSQAFGGLPWKEQRRFALHTLRDLGFGKTRMEGHLQEEIEEVLDRLSASCHKPVRMSDIIAPSASNNIASFLFGTRLKYNDPKRKDLDRLLSEVGLRAGATVWQAFFPWLAAITKFLGVGSQPKLSKALQDVRQYCEKEVRQHESTLDANNIRDYVDSYLLEIEKRASEPETTFKRDILIDISRGFFGAGSETVRISVDWMILFCAARPEIQDKIQKEIDDVLGKDRFPTGQDRFAMPYTEAVFCEVMRYVSLIPINLMRTTLCATELNGYYIPKDMSVLAVLYAVNRDKTLWGEDVNEFKVERFLSPDGEKCVKPEFFIPFSIGKRSCPGKVLAEIEVFLYVVAILQKFRVSLPEGREADLDGVLGIGLQPKRQELILKPRH